MTELTHLNSSSLHVAWQMDALLGEGPVWDDAIGVLYWLDIKGCKLLIMDVGHNTKNITDLSVVTGAIALRSNNNLIAATKKGFAELNPQTGSMVYLADPEAHIPDNRFNDGKCDPAGNFIAGTMDELEKEPTGTVYRFDSGGTAVPLFGKFIVCNGPAFNPDGTKLYFSDSVNRTILEFDYNCKSGVVGSSKTLARLSKSEGFPDGLTVDKEGYIWCAHWDGWRLTRFDPDGKVDRIVNLPVPRVTSCTFGGESMDTLYITTARTGLSNKTISTAPLSGSLFAIKPGVIGMPSNRYAD